MDSGDSIHMFLRDSVDKILGKDGCISAGRIVLRVKMKETLLNCEVLAEKVKKFQLF